jgi:hypothetical protein
MKNSKLSLLIERIKCERDQSETFDEIINLNVSLANKVVGGIGDEGCVGTNTACSNTGCSNNGCGAGNNENNSTCTNTSCHPADMSNQACTNNSCQNFACGG